MAWHVPVHRSRVAVTCCQHTFTLLRRQAKKKKPVDLNSFFNSSPHHSNQLNLPQQARAIQLLRKGPFGGMLRAFALYRGWKKWETVTWVKVFTGIRYVSFLFLFAVILLSSTAAVSKVLWRLFFCWC